MYFKAPTLCINPLQINESQCELRAQRIFLQSNNPNPLSNGLKGFAKNPNVSKEKKLSTKLFFFLLFMTFHFNHLKMGKN